jgi:hypothetical protein
MPRIKPAAEIAAKWARVAPTRQQDYEQGVKDPSVAWAAPTAAAQDTYEAGVTEAIQTKRYARGVNAAGDETWRRKVGDQGAQRWAPGVRAAQADYEKGFAPMAAVIERTQLPPRGPRGDERNMQRAAVMAKALSEARRRG